jgi:hypothetical protein
MAITGVQTTYTAAPAIGYAGMRQGDQDDDIVTMKNVESTLAMPFGIGVIWKTSGATSDIDALLPSTQADLVAGIVVHSHTHPLQYTDAGGSHGELSATGLVPGTLFNVLRQGKIMVQVATAVKPSDRLFVRAVANGAISNQRGSCENAADSTNMIDCTKQGQFLTTAAVAGFAWLDVNFTAKP